MQYPPVQARNGSLTDRIRNLTRKSGIETHGLRAGLKPEKGWARRNYEFVSQAVIPTILKPREGDRFAAPPSYGDLNHHEIEVIWIGHASFLVRTPHHNILIDPNWAMWMGPLKRAKHPGLQIDHLPKIDLVLVSHAHMDHLHRPTLRQIAKGQTLIVPKGVTPLVRNLNFGEIHELDLWDDFRYGELDIVFTPAFHWGARFFADMHRGFGGFILKTAHRSLYHSGDSAYFDGFVDIGKRHDIDTAILPIGAYDNPSGREVHMNPEEALQAFEDLNANRMIPMHHETFPLGIGKPCEPMRRLNAAAESKNLVDRVIAPREGEQLIISH